MSIFAWYDTSWLFRTISGSSLEPSQIVSSTPDWLKINKEQQSVELLVQKKVENKIVANKGAEILIVNG